MFLVKVNNDTKDYTVLEIKKGEDIPFNKLGVYTRHRVYVAKETNMDKLLDRLEREFKKN